VILVDTKVHQIAIGRKCFDHNEMCKKDRSQTYKARQYLETEGLSSAFVIYFSVAPYSIECKKKKTKEILQNQQGEGFGDRRSIHTGGQAE